MNIDHYLERLDYNGSVDPTLETLRELHRHHLENVPFENLDIALGRTIAIDTDAFFHKIVHDCRGGFCYELNGAFAALLSALGFRVTLLSARVSRLDGTHSPEFDHLALRIDLDEPWLADVGFGDCFRDPLRLQSGAEQGDFRFIEYEDGLQLQRAGRPIYLVELTPRRLTDFAEMCHYHQTSPDSHFTQNRICSKATPTGRITLTDRALIITEDAHRHQAAIQSEQEFQAALREHFSINLSSPSVAKPNRL